MEKEGLKSIICDRVISALDRCTKAACVFKRGRLQNETRTLPANSCRPDFCSRELKIASNFTPQLLFKDHMVGPG